MEATHYNVTIASLLTPFSPITFYAVITQHLGYFLLRVHLRKVGGVLLDK